MTFAHFHLCRLRIMSRGRAVYDQAFHTGVNIIRGENGSGKSTIADFVFYILGGEFDNWKTVAGRCDEVQAEVFTRGGVVTLRRPVERAQTPILVFFGPMAEAEVHGLDSWQSYPIRRSSGRESFSQILFRASGIPEAQSEGASNITMHQVLRLLYSDQRTPSAFLFRYEPFDTRDIREAVGDLLCGLSVYELYESELALRDLDKQFETVNERYRMLLGALPKEVTLVSVDAIDGQLRALADESDNLKEEIENSEVYIGADEVDSFVRARREANTQLRKFRREIDELEREKEINDLETADITKFVEYLGELSDKLPRAETSSEIIGQIDFTHCPACLAPLHTDKGPHFCALCGADTDLDKERSRYLQIKLDIDIQLRESRQLLEDKKGFAKHNARALRRLRSSFNERLTEYSVRYELSSSPRESFLAERYQRLGQIDRERSGLEGIREKVGELELISAEKAEVQGKIETMRDRQKALHTANQRRRGEALTRVSNTARSVLREDLNRQDEFKSALSVSLNFADNSVMVDGDLNFAESSNVVVKNSSILSLFLAATEDEAFHHPRFVLFDNIEDKGMEQERSHNFQDILVRMSEAAKMPHQIIYTTSMFNPSLDEDRYAIGPYYTHDRRTLVIE